MPPELSDRAVDIWEPLFVIADLADLWPERARSYLAFKVQPDGNKSAGTPVGPLVKVVPELMAFLFSVRNFSQRPRKASASLSVNDG